jgi:hypothetical protein
MIKKRPFARLMTCGLLTAALSPTPSAAAEAAQSLHQEHCTRCHGSEVYTRADRKVSSYDALLGQVQRCELSLQLTWFDDDIAKVADHLNQHFYHFPR